MMAVEINLKLEIKTLGTIHSTGERVLFTLENEPNNPKRPILKSFSEVKPPQHDVIDILYFCANDAIQGITFFWTKEGIVQTWSRNLSGVTGVTGLLTPR
jgi:hypothetical protein